MRLASKRVSVLDTPTLSFQCYVLPTQRRQGAGFGDLLPEDGVRVVLREQQYRGTSLIRNRPPSRGTIGP